MKKFLICILSITGIKTANAQFTDGRNWQKSTTPVSSAILDIDYASPCISYAACSDGTILKSTNSGLSYVAQVSGTTAYLDQICFVSEVKGFVGGNNGAVRATSNGGTTWTQIPYFNSNPLTVRAITFFDANIGCIGGANAPNAGLHLTKDGGATWQKLILPSGAESVYGIYFFDANTIIVCGSSGLIYKTVNQGLTWADVSYGNPTSIDNLILTGLVFKDALNGYCSGGSPNNSSQNGLLIKTTDGGLSWTNVTNLLPAPNAYIGIRYVNADTLYVIGGNIAANTDYIAFSNNGGTTWARNTGYNTSRAVKFTSTFGKLAFCGLNGAIWQTNISDNSLDITASNATICAGQSTQLNASPGYDSYTWSPTTGLNNPNISNPMAMPTITTTYTLTATLNGCTTKSSIKITVTPKLKPTFDIIKNDTCLLLTINNQMAGSNFIWNFGDNTTSTAINPKYNYSTAGNYTVSLISNPNTPCADTSSMSVSFSRVEFATATPTYTKCSNDTVQFNATGGNAYNWQPSVGLNNANIANPNCFVKNTTTYMLTVTHKNGCTDTAKVTVNVKPSPTVNAGKDVFICANEQPTLNAIGNANTYRWSPGTLVSDSTILNPQFIGKANSVLIIKATTNACEASDTLIVKFLKDTIIEFSYTILPCKNTIMGAFNYNSDSVSVNYGDGIIENRTGFTTFEHTYTDTGSYIVTLTNHTLCNTSYSETISLSQKALNLESLPNIFTPNNDGKNEFFEIAEAVCTPISMLIFNRWGQKVFDSTIEKTLQWNGKINSFDVPEGVYIYIISGNNVSKSGTVSLYR